VLLEDYGHLAGQVRRALKGLADLERIAGRIALMNARPRDLSALRDSLAQLPELADILAAPPSSALEASPLLAQLAAELVAPGEALDLLCRAIAAEPAALIRDGGVIAPGFDAELDELRALSDNCGAFLMDLEARERERTGIASLKVEYNKVHGFYIEVTHTHTDKIPEDYRRRQTLKNAERYITPELKVFEDKALSAQERGLACEKALFEDILTRLQPEVGRLQAIARAVAQLDMLASFADTALRRNWCRPEFSHEPGLYIEAGRHPVVEGEMEGSGASFIANDLELSGSRRLLLITGPNMGGKSTYMRQTALIALLAQVGSFVPARTARLGPLDRIFTRIGASDDLASGRSTFMVEMTEAAAILHHASPNSLVLMDEIGRGTSTFDGLALAFAICRHLLEKNRSLTLFATHYFELTRLAQDHPTLANVHLDAVEHGDRIVFLHAVEEGPANQSYGIQVAALAGMPGAVVRAAKSSSGNWNKKLRKTPCSPTCLPAPRPWSRKSGRSPTRCWQNSKPWTRTASAPGKPWKPCTVSRKPCGKHRGKPCGQPSEQQGSRGSLVAIRGTRRRLSAAFIGSDHPASPDAAAPGASSSLVRDRAAASSISRDRLAPRSRESSWMKCSSGRVWIRTRRPSSRRMKPPARRRPTWISGRCDVSRVVK